MSKISGFPLFFFKKKFIDESPFALLSDEIVLHIFKYLSGPQLFSSCALVSHRWKNLTRDYSIVRSHIPPWIKSNVFNVIYQNLENKELLKEYLKLGPFLTKCTMSQIKSSSNHNFNKYKHEGYAFRREYGNYKFFTQKWFKILIKKNDEIYNTIQFNCEINSLAVLNEMLFTFDEDGVIRQWNYITGDLIQTLNTQKHETSLSRTYNGFFVFKNNLFLGKYKTSFARERSLKIVPYKNRSAKERIIVSKNFTMFENVKVKEDKLFIFFKTKVYCYNLSNKGTLDRFFYMDIQRHLWYTALTIVDITYKDNLLFIIDKYNRIFKIDILTKKIIRQHVDYCVGKTKSFIELIQNTFLVYHASTDSIILRDRKSGKSIISRKLEHNSEDLLFLLREIQQHNQKRPLDCNIA